MCDKKKKWFLSIQEHARAKFSAMLFNELQDLTEFKKNVQLSSGPRN